MGDATIRYIFLLMALLIVVSYFIGAATDINALTAGLARLWNVGTGRDAQGHPSGYPTGGGSIQTFG